MTNLSPTSHLVKISCFFSIVLAFANPNNTYASKVGIAAPSITLQTSGNISIPADSVYTMVEKMPEFTGGDKALITFMNQTIVYPAEALKNKEQGKVIVQFIVSKTGKIEKETVLKGISPSLDNEALRVIRLFPDWIPGEQNGEKVAVYRTVPVSFKAIDPNDESAWEVNDKTLIVVDGAKMPANFNIGIINPSKIMSAVVLKPFPKEEKSRLIDLYGKQAANGVLVITSNKDEMYYTLADSAYTNAACKEEASLPEFVGGKDSLKKYLSDSIQYPFVAKQLKKEGKVAVQFKVDTNGKISDAKVKQSADYYLDKEALRVVSTMPNWTPSAKCDQKLNILVTMPVVFKLELPAGQKGWERNDKTIVLIDGERVPASFDLNWLNYTNLASYKVLQPGDKATNKKLTSQYGKDAINGVVLVETNKQVESGKE